MYWATSRTGYHPVCEAGKFCDDGWVDVVAAEGVLLLKLLLFLKMPLLLTTSLAKFIPPRTLGPLLIFFPDFEPFSHGLRTSIPIDLAIVVWSTVISSAFERELVGGDGSPYDI